MIIDIRRKAFGEKVVLQDLRLEIPVGKVTVIEGPSGRGKTTLIRIISGLDEDYEGFVKGGPEKPIVLFQEDRLVEEISLEANLLMVSSDKSRVLRLISELGLENELKSKVSSFSGGMKRRVAIARALLMDYDALFLDEPFKGLDDALKEKVASLMIKENNGRTMIVISHDRMEAELLGATNTIKL